MNIVYYKERDCSCAQGPQGTELEGRLGEPSGQDRRQLRASPVALAKPGPEASKTWGGKGQVSLGQGSVCVIDLVLSRSCGQAGWLPRPLSSPGKPQAQLQACGRPPCCLWAPGHHRLPRTQPATVLTDTQTHATTHWPQDHSNSGHTEPLIQSPATQQPRSHRNRTTLLPQQNLPSSH